MAEKQNLQELLSIIKQASPKSYNRIIANKKDWTTMYHLSHLRANVIEWLPICKSDTVLEIGAGCGALTSLFCERAAQVCALERDEEQTIINRERNLDRNNLVLVSGTLENVHSEFEDGFDWIFAIDQFMDSAMNQWEENSLTEFIRIASRLLKPQGKLVIALPNRFGLKYLAGSVEERTGKFFEGVQGFPSVNGSFSYTKQELTRAISSAGEFSCRFYYPYPDHVFAMSIYSDDYLPKLGELRTNHNNFDHARPELFDETEAFDSIIESGTFPQFSNSFMVVLTGGGKHE